MRLLWKGKARGDGVGKKKVKSEEEFKNMMLPATRMAKKERIPENLA